MGYLLEGLATVFEQHGLNTFLVVCGAVMIFYFIYKIVDNQGTITETQEKILHVIYGHDERQKNMQTTCLSHGEKIESLTIEVNNLKQQTAILNERVREERR